MKLSNTNLSSDIFLAWNKNMFKVLERFTNKKMKCSQPGRLSAMTNKEYKKIPIMEHEGG